MYIFFISTDVNYLNYFVYFLLQIELTPQELQNIIQNTHSELQLVVTNMIFKFLKNVEIDDIDQNLFLQRNKR